MISRTLLMVHFYPMSWMRRVRSEFTEGHWAGPWSTEGELLGGWVLSYVLHSVSSLRTLLLSPGSQGWASHRSSQGGRTSLMDFSPATGSSPSTERNTFLNSHPILTLLLHTLHPLRSINCQIIGFFECASIRYQCIVQSCNTGSTSLSHKVLTLIEQNSFIWKENPISGRRCFHITFSWTCSSGELTLSDWPFWMILEIVEKVPFRYIKLKGAVVC